MIDQVAAEQRTVSSAANWSAGRPHPLGDLEIQYLCLFGADAIDRPETRVQLWMAWGMCHRHALGFLAVEASLHQGWLFRPAIVYDDVIDRGRYALAPRRLFERARVGASLREAEPCQPCALGLTPDEPAEPEAATIVDEGRGLDPLRSFASETRRHWERWVCGKCAGSESPTRCRLHLAEDLDAGRGAGLPSQRVLVEDLSSHLRAYARSFGWSSRGTETAADRAALIGAVGWCGGWESILRFLP